MDFFNIDLFDAFAAFDDLKDDLHFTFDMAYHRQLYTRSSYFHSLDEIGFKRHFHLNKETVVNIFYWILSALRLTREGRRYVPLE